MGNDGEGEERTRAAVGDRRSRIKAEGFYGKGEVGALSSFSCGGRGFLREVVDLVPAGGAFCLAGGGWWVVPFLLPGGHKAKAWDPGLWLVSFPRDGEASDSENEPGSRGMNIPRWSEMDMDMDMEAVRLA